MNLFDREQFEAFVSAMPAAHIVHQWGNASVGKVGEKIFATHAHWDDNEEWQISFKCSDLSFDLLPELSGVKKAKYLARAKWVTVRETSEVTSDELRAYVTEAHRLVALKMSKPTKEKLGLTDPQFFKI